ncbi:aldo/keto reductase [Consotaella aegiceratis]|uniref:aldo/keto reductase n=1 Tax=Consotaella aegiceratis TaxID=3097961 RepID=UPI002F3EFE49
MATTASTRRLGRSGIAVSAIGLGGWAIGGPFTLDGRPDGWGDVDDAQSLRAIQAAVDYGVTLIDTADVYGAGHSERVVGRAIAGRRDRIVVATKFGYLYNEATRVVGGTDVSPAYVEKAVQRSLARLGTDYIDLYQIHVGTLDADALPPLAEALERLAEAGTIRAWGWSTDDAAHVEGLLVYPHFAAVQQDLNLFVGNGELLALAERGDLASLNRSPLAMGLLSGKFDRTARLGPDDVRGAGHSWVRYFKNGQPEPHFLEQLAAVRDLLRTGGRNLAQGALGWLLAQSPATIPIPGFKTERQARENARALSFGPLPQDVVTRIAAVLEGFDRRMEDDADEVR